FPFTIGYKTKINSFSNRVKLLSEEISENLRLSSSSKISPKRTFGNIGYLSETEIPDFPFKTASIFDCTSNPNGVMQFVSEMYIDLSIKIFPFFVSTFHKMRDCKGPNTGFIHKKLNGLNFTNQFVIFVKNLIRKNHFGSQSRDKRCFDNSIFPVFQRNFMLTFRFYDRHDITLLFNIQIRQIMLTSESLTSLLKINEIISVPY